MSPNVEPLVWLAGEVRTPPFSPVARIEAGFLLRRLQQDESLSMPHARPMPVFGRGCHELRIVDRGSTWRIVYHVEADAVVKGQTASSSYKPAQMSNGVRVMVPPFVETGTRIVVNTADGTYLKRTD